MDGLTPHYGLLRMWKHWGLNFLHDSSVLRPTDLYHTFGRLLWTSICFLNTVYVTEVSVHEHSKATNLYSSGCFCNMSNYCCTACKLSNSGMCHVFVLIHFLNFSAQQLINVRLSVFEFCLQMSIHCKILSHTWYNWTGVCTLVAFEIWHHSQTLPFVPVD